MKNEIVKVIIENKEKKYDTNTILIDFIDNTSLANFAKTLHNQTDNKTFMFLFHSDSELLRLLADKKFQELTRYFDMEKLNFSSMIEIQFNNLPKNFRVKKTPYDLNTINLVKIINSNFSNIVLDQKENSYFKWFIIQNVNNEIQEII